MLNITVFASHGGTDTQAIIDGCQSGAINGKVVLVISNNADAYVLTRAANAGIPHVCLNRAQFENDAALDARTLALLREYKTDMVFLAGYLKKMSPAVLEAYENRVFNVHPALLPKYGGKGMFGMHVHTAVIAAGEKESGATIHRVNTHYDSGDIVAQATVPVLPGDTPEALAARVLEREHTLLVETIARIANGDIPLGK